MRAQVILTQIWPAARIKNLFSAASDRLETQAADAAASAAGHEPLWSFVARELAKALDEVQAQGAVLGEARMGKARAQELHCLGEAVGRLQDVVSFCEPLATAKPPASDGARCKMASAISKPCSTRTITSATRKASWPKWLPISRG